MSLIVGKLSANRENFNAFKILKFIFALPSPELMSILEQSNNRINPKKMLITFQGELAHFHSSEQDSMIEEIGTQDLSQCIGLYLYSETDHVFMHIDENKRTIDFDAIIDKFTDKTNIKAMIFGGNITQGEEISRVSETNLSYICSAMAFSKYPIELIAQTILSNNVSKGENELMLVAEIMISKMKYVYYHLFHCELDHACHDDFMPSDFLYKRGICQHESLQKMIDALLLSDALMTQETFMAIDALRQDNITQDETIRQFQAVFSVTGLELIKGRMGIAILGKYGPLMRSFTINLQSKKIRLTYAGISTPFEDARIIRGNETMYDKNLSQIYDKDHYIFPVLGNTSLNLINFLKSNITEDSMNDLECNYFQSKLGTNSPILVNRTMHATRNYLQPTQKPLMIQHKIPAAKPADVSIPQTQKVNSSLCTII